MAKAALVSVSFVAAPALDEDGRNIYGYVGDHNDEVPEDNMTDGSWFLAKDTKKIDNPRDQQKKREGKP